MTPLEIQLLLHIYGCRSPIENVGAPAQRAALAMFEREEAIKRDKDDPTNAHGWKLAARGQAFVDRLLAMHLPEAIWIDPKAPQPGPIHPASPPPVALYKSYDLPARYTLGEGGIPLPGE